MTLPEAREIISENRKWLKGLPPYHFDPDADDMYPARPSATPTQLSEALETILNVEYPQLKYTQNQLNDAVERVFSIIRSKSCTPTSTPSPATTGAAPSSPPAPAA